MTAFVRPPDIATDVASGAHANARFERLLDGFQPTFEFEPVAPLPEAEFVDRLRRIRREATVAGHDVMLVHADSIGSYRIFEFLPALHVRLGARRRARRADG
jgi:hypothetical protein